MKVTRPWPFKTDAMFVGKYGLAIGRRHFPAGQHTERVRKRPVRRQSDFTCGTDRQRANVLRPERRWATYPEAVQAAAGLPWSRGFARSKTLMARPRYDPPRGSIQIKTGQACRHGRNSSGSGLASLDRDTHSPLTAEARTINFLGNNKNFHRPRGAIFRVLYGR